jgi:hypothetical protein
MGGFAHQLVTVRIQGVRVAATCRVIDDQDSATQWARSSCAAVSTLGELRTWVPAEHAAPDVLDLLGLKQAVQPGEGCDLGVRLEIGFGSSSALAITPAAPS